MTRTPSGAAMIPTSTRRVSSDMRTPAWPAARAPGGGSDFHDLGLFGLDQVVDFMDVVVARRLQVFLGGLDVVLADTVQLFQGLARVRARVPDGDLAFLGELVDDLHQLLAPLLIH